ncbi:hypothetical protein C5O78_09160 [Treponema phagedenis]|nr:hypothetical protein C5O78_09160 [Treponema phagedenis]
MPDFGVSRKYRKNYHRLKTHQNGSFTKAKDWYKVRGTAILVNEDGDEYRAEIHWYQCKNIGKVEIKQKRIIKVIHEGSK